VNGPDDAWSIRVLFQATKDLSLLVPSLRHTTGYGKTPKYYLVLEKAAVKFPLLDRWVKEGQPEIIVITFDEAVHFLETSGPELEMAGFGVRLPSWMHQGGSVKGISLVAHAGEMSEHQPGHLTMASVMRINWQVCLGADFLTPEEIEEIARLKSPLLKMRGKWVYVSAEEIQAIARLLKEGLTAQFSGSEIVRLAMDGKTADGLPMGEVVATGRWKNLLETLGGSIALKELPPPTGLKATLRPYQQRGFFWLAFMAQTGMGVCLADDMGLGKTVQTLAFLQHQWENGERKPALLVCPTSLLENWRREACQFTPMLRVGIHHGQKRASSLGEFFLRYEEHSLVITSYAVLARDADIIRQINWSAVILDEAQNIKNPDTQQARTARSIPTAFRIALTGTPVENTVADLWSIMEFLNPGYLGTRKEFEKQFLLPLQEEQGKEAMERLKRLTRPFLLRRLKTDPDVCPDLPAKLESKVFCTLTQEQATLYATVLRGEWHAVANSNGGQRSISILRLIGHLKQVCNHPVHYLKDRSELPERSGKLERLTEILEQVRTAGKAALVFTQYQEMGDLLRQHLSTVFGESEVLFLHGGISVEDRKKMTDCFQTKDGPPIFIRSLKAGGTGETLTRATHVIHFDRWWNPAVENQATDRAHRIGQREEVHVHKLICAGTLEDRIDQMIERKSVMMGQVIDAGDHWLAELSTDEVRKLVALDDALISD
jgi:SNF2 family DNA or RNA helicase